MKIKVVNLELSREEALALVEAINKVINDPDLPSRTVIKLSDCSTKICRALRDYHAK